VCETGISSTSSITLLLDLRRYDFPIVGDHVRGIPSVRDDGVPLGPKRAGGLGEEVSVHVQGARRRDVVDAIFSKSHFVSLTDEQARNELCLELAATLARRMGQATDFGNEARRCVEELRALGHDLWSFDESDEFQAWCPNYEQHTGPGIVITFSVPDEVIVEWATGS